jgi:hypothetical protein
MGQMSLYRHLNKQQTWIGHGDLTFTYVTCVATIGHHLFQAFQICLKKKKKTQQCQETTILNLTRSH